METVKKIYTARDAARAKASLDVWVDLHAKAEVEHKRIMGTLRANPEIGMLMRNGKPVYYVNTSNSKIEAADPADLVWEVGK
jgi:hypothetical protein